VPFRCAPARSLALVRMAWIFSGARRCFALIPSKKTSVMVSGANHLADITVQRHTMLPRVSITCADITCHSRYIRAAPAQPGSAQTGPGRGDFRVGWQYSIFYSRLFHNNASTGGPPIPRSISRTGRPADALLRVPTTKNLHPRAARPPIPPLTHFPDPAILQTVRSETDWSVWRDDE
jgi:hypothetical protein